MKKQILFILLLTVSVCECMHGNKITSASKENSMNRETSEITVKYWKLIVLEGQKITMSPNAEKEAYFTLFPADSSIKGHGGCNAFFGTYALIEGNRIRISNLGSTEKACAGVT